MLKPEQGTKKLAKLTWFRKN